MELWAKGNRVLSEKGIQETHSIVVVRLQCTLDLRLDDTDEVGVGSWLLCRRREARGGREGESCYLSDRCPRRQDMDQRRAVGLVASPKEADGHRGGGRSGTAKSSGEGHCRGRWNRK